MLSPKSRKARAKAREHAESRFALGENRAEILRDMERGRPATDVDHVVRQRWAPARSTFYGWAKQFDEARARDRSGAWTLATEGTENATGHPDLVVQVLGALVAASKGHRATLTVAEATWIVRVCLAFPAWVDAVDPDGDDVDRTTGEPIPGAWQRRVYDLASRFVDAETGPDPDDKLAEVTAEAALLHGTYAGAIGLYLRKD